ncbi:hypothetical protein ABQF26_05315 [Mycolicibacterium elephantis]
MDKSSPTDYAKRSELVGNGITDNGIYGITDGVSDEQFEEAITEARNTGNLSRANVARKCRERASSPRP